jgi:phosphatidylglycerol:prolipoprotein diacylglycerol transferase
LPGEDGVHPDLFEVHGFRVTSFGVMMVLGFLIACWITVVRLREEGIDSRILVWVVLGGVVGSKLYFAVDFWLRHGRSFLALLTSQGGVTWYGGLLGGALGAFLGAGIYRVSWVHVANCASPGLALGQAVGRFGCFLVGDDYGRATDLPWAVAFPHGAPPTLERVHPTQLYELLWLVLVAGYLWRRRKSSSFLFGEYLVLSGLGRFLIEYWRLNPSAALGLTQAQWIGLAAMMLGAAGLFYYQASGSGEHQAHARPS